MLAQRGHRSHPWRRALDVVRRQERRERAAGRVDADPSAARGELRMRGDGRDVVDRTGGDVGRIEQSRSTWARVRAAKCASMSDSSGARFATRSSLLTKRGSSASAGSSSTNAHSRRHSRSVCTARSTSPSEHPYAPYGTTMLWRTPILGAVLPVPLNRFSGGIIHSVMHSSIEMSMRAPRPVLLRSSSAARIDEYAYSPAPMSAIDTPTFAGASSVPVIPTIPGLGLHEHVVGLAVAIRAVRAVAGDPAPDEARMARGKLVVTQAEPLHGAGREIVHEDVGAREEPLAHVAIVRVLHIEHDAALAAIQPREVRRDAVERAIVMAREIAAAGPLDLDHVRAHVGELARAERSGRGLLERDDPYAIER